jgi:hypothetical protein
MKNANNTSFKGQGDQTKSTFVYAGRAEEATGPRRRCAAPRCPHDEQGTIGRTQGSGGDHLSVKHDTISVVTRNCKSLVSITELLSCTNRSRRFLFLVFANPVALLTKDKPSIPSLFQKG